MRKITIEIEVPEDAEGRTFYGFLGRECFVIVTPQDEVYVKNDRCVRCGKCCRNPGNFFPEYKPDGKGFFICAHCDEEIDGWQCRNQGVPFGCLRDEYNAKNHPDCNITYRKK